MVGFEESRAYYRHPEKVAVTGTPVRGDFFRYTKKEAREKLGISDGRPLLLSYWGSLGASEMNRRMVDFIAGECGDNPPFHHIHGAGGDYRGMLEAFSARKLDLKACPSMELREYIYDMPLVMAAADLVLCRAGASTLSELIAIARPAILVPSPNVTNHHQEKNAGVLAACGGAVMVREPECTGLSLYKLASGLLADPEKRAAMSRALSSMAIPDAAEQIYGTLTALLR
jgi:UDP-N-acetylglucosamine--N-acetylmuramyl-(pentapeptide) pyrophosphoryl-undecaprenol N-acetylglucosamine transferase